MTGPYIENCFCLTAKRTDDSWFRPRKIGDNIIRDYERHDINYQYEKIGDDYYLNVVVGENTPQKILTETLETYFGDRTYFHCNKCDCRCHKLFLLPDGHIFLCKNCHGIKYQNFNPHSKQGQVLIRAKKILKLIYQQERMTSRIWYRSVYTKRYEKFLNNCLKIGLTDVVEEARSLEAIITRMSEK